MQDDIIKAGYTRVTEVMHRYTNFSGIPAEVLENAARRGTKVHAYCSLLAQGIPMAFEDKECEGYVSSFKDWFDKYVSSVIVNEERFYCDTLMITGAIDLVLRLKGSNAVTIVDIKTPASESKTWALQTAAYQYLYNESKPDAFAVNRIVIQINKSGKPAKAITYDDPKDIDVYKGILAAERYFA